MNKKSTFRSVANNYLTHPNQHSGVSQIITWHIPRVRFLIWHFYFKNILEDNRTTFCSSFLFRSV